MNGKPVEVLVFDNVRPARLTLDELLGGGVRVWLFDEAADDVSGERDENERVFSADASACLNVLSQAVSTAPSK